MPLQRMGKNRRIGMSAPEYYTLLLEVVIFKKRRRKSHESLHIFSQPQPGNFSGIWPADRLPHYTLILLKCSPFQGVAH